MNNIYRNQKDVVGFGIISGISRSTGYDVSLLRVLYAIFGLINLPVALSLYLLSTLVIKVEPSDYGNQNVHTVDIKPITPQFVIGVFLVLIGLSAVLKPLFSWLNFGFIFALLLIGAGALFIIKKGKVA